MRPFLQAHWAHLAIVTYDVPADLLSPYLPRGLTLDTRDGKHFLSLVAFEFENTRVKGIGWPMHTDFPEVNLRFYVRRGSERGVCFIREFVPKRLVAWIAGSIYHEPYEYAPIECDVHRTDDGLKVTHKFKHHDRWQVISLSAGREAPQLPDEEGLECWLMDQQYGFTKDHDGRSRRYHVVHPRWMTYKIHDAEVKVNFHRVYGEQFRFLERQKPCSTILAEGSEVEVYPCARC